MPSAAAYHPDQMMTAALRERSIAAMSSVVTPPRPAPSPATAPGATADVLVAFGITGDLAKQMTLRSLYRLEKRGLLKCPVVGVAVQDWTDDDLRDRAREAIVDGGEPLDPEVFDRFAARLSYLAGDFGDAATFERLAAALAGKRSPVFYLEIPPFLFGAVVKGLSGAGLLENARVVVEKPFGHDLESARELNATINKVFPPESVFRIDHYLGKETVQNILAMRFANNLFEPIWNANYVDHVQITMAEDIGIGGRAGYYDGIGAARDVIQNHLLQLMALVAMEEPTSFDAASLRIEKQKVLSSVVLPRRLDLNTARGQYAAGWAGGEQVNGYLDEDDIKNTSTTETFAAIRVDVDTRRWAGVPFYLRTGKRLGRRVTEVAVVFKRAPHLPFTATATEDLTHNAIVFRIQPDEGATIRFGSKVPGSSMEIRDVNMDFAYGGSFTEASPEAYERLILDVLLGDPPLFPQQDEVELSWKILDPVMQHWAKQDAAGKSKPEQYESGNWGPESAHAMLARDGRVWRRP
jgi:glucose-6-phosphate 1-dehydrogenase